MRAALCMYGKIGGMLGKDGAGKTIDFVKCYLSIQEHIIDVNKCDVFMHCWNPEHRDTLLKTYRPKKHIIESQIPFNTTLKSPKDRRDEFICKSRWYSHKKTLGLKREYEKENGFVYDWVMLCRYDLLFFVDFNFAELEPDIFYASHFNDWGFKGRSPNRENHSIKTRRYLDMWFIGSSAFMDRFANIYDVIYKYGVTDPHRASWDYIESFAGDPMKITKFKFFRWYDYELIRNRHGA